MLQIPGETREDEAYLDITAQININVAISECYFLSLNSGAAVLNLDTTTSATAVC